MQKKFITNLILLLSLNLLVKPFWILGIDRTVQNIVGSESYGFYFAIFNFSFLFNIFLDLGITNFNNRNIAQNNQLLNKHFSSIVILKLLLGLVFVFITFLIALIIGYNGEQLKFLGFLAFNQFLISFILYLRSNISGLLLFKTDSFISILDRVLMIIICGILIWGNVTDQEFKIEWFIYAQSAAYLLTALIALLVVIKKAAFRKFNWNRPFFIMIIKQSLPFALLVLLMTFYNRIDSVVLERILPKGIGNEQVGIYAHGYRLLDASNMIAFLFSVLLLPIFSKMIKQKESVEELIKLAFSLLITISVIVALGSHFYSYELMHLLYEDHVQESAHVFSLLMFGFIAISTTYIFGTLLTANGNLKQLNIVAASGMIINLTINIILIPELLAVGSAYASLSAQFITAIAQIFVVQWIFKFRINYKYLLNIIFFILSVVAINIISKQLNFEWTTNFILMLIVSIISAIIFRLFNIKSIIKIIYMKN